MVTVNYKTNKLDVPYEGPYKVKRITQGGSYVLEDEKGNLLPKNYPSSALKMISQDEVISSNKFYQVEAILAHKKVKGKYIYKCRWKGYDESEDTWEPTSHFADLKFIAEYWQRIDLKETSYSSTTINEKNKSQGRRKRSKRY
ncbi:hypothetical protein RO3G_12680 [Rhizopus delemar RA 99-880]|uniref:Chromo domain-containing protein n=1 Tax=Rhizopus delemar (strain RA 99-880 / ATCC MYA-4621 / FGSC 9543 / NRRL 43880) TaxID=246409 RepID=I1CHN9_RHIO9|nr:hypothetical protein RO3G_12680 [Rhizopus delemar RA 99-880]|eukprot:EIE87969.1 hypothetical protein RO3G_12680 [Rhizopus delemar RA 99-880]